MWVHYGALITIGFDVEFKSCQEPQIPKDAAYFPWHSAGLRFSPGVVKTRATCLDLDPKIGTCLREVLLPPSHHPCAKSIAFCARKHVGSEALPLRNAAKKVPLDRG